MTLSHRKLARVGVMGELGLASTNARIDVGRYFANCLRNLRQRVLGKQICLSHALGCTDAAVSLWESGKRLPHDGTLSRMLEVLADCGASRGDLDALVDSWRLAKLATRGGPV